MKQVILVFAIILGISVSVNAQTDSKEVKNANQKMELKAHVCTSACQNGNHVYAHGEKGHVCTAACKGMNSKTVQTGLKDHVCTGACKNGKHIYVHGEKGHVCTKECSMKI